MPALSRPTLRRPGLIAAAALVGCAAVPAMASAACATSTTSTPFRAWGDTAAYALLTNGGFESGTTGWSLGGASVVSGNEPWKVRSSGDSRSLKIPAGKTVVSPALCVDITKPTWRFFTKRISGTWGGITYAVRYRDASGATVQTTLGYLDGTTSWAPTAVLPLSTSLALWNSSQTLQVQLVFTTSAGGGDFQIDDVYVDPYVRG